MPGVYNARSQAKWLEKKAKLEKRVKKKLLNTINKDVQKWKEQVREQLKFKEWLIANHGDILTTYEVLKRLGEIE